MRGVHPKLRRAICLVMCVLIICMTVSFVFVAAGHSHHEMSCVGTHCPICALIGFLRSATNAVVLAAVMASVCCSAVCRKKREACRKAGFVSPLSEIRLDN